jgi:ribonucleoside-diphosphate reductase alpha chain
MIAGSYPDGGLGEVFLKLGKQGSTLAGVMDAFSIAVSIGLQYGVPLETFVQKFTNVSFEPAGLTDDRDIRIAKSLMDYIFRRLALDYLPLETRLSLGIQTADERSAELDSTYVAADSFEAPTSSNGVSTDSFSALIDADEETHNHNESHSHEHSENHAQARAHSDTELFEILQNLDIDTPLCFSCGIKMRRSGSCHVCEGCGSTSGCS